MRLLLVEDDAPLAGSIRRSLEQAGYAVDVAGDGIEAESLGNEGVYALAVLDLGLPRRGGLEVLAHWRAHGNALPVIVLTARDAWYEKVEGFKAGADDYLAKPFHIEELVARITALLHRSNSQSGGLLKVGELELDEQRQTVITRSGETVELTGIEFRLLRCFLLHPDRILSQSRLSEQVYDFDSDKESNVIEVYINHLRRKLGKAIIETKRGQGYRFNTGRS
jgi:DNA-binding response OmpR family regulator